MEVVRPPGVALVKISAKAGNQLLEVTIERRDGRYRVALDGVRYTVDARKLEGDFYSIVSGDRSYEVSVEARKDGYRVRHGAAEQLVTFSDPSRGGREGFAAAEGPEKVITTMPGKVVRVLVNEGDQVEEGQGLVVVEAMKMENEITAPKSGRVSSVTVTPDQTVEGNTTLVVIE